MQDLQGLIHESLRKHNNTQWPRQAKWAKPFATMLQVGSFSGIYMLCKDHRIVYVGRTSVALQRISQHMQSKEFDDVVFVQLDEQWVNVVEGALIAALRPPLNVHIPAGEWSEADAKALLLKAWKLSGKRRTVML